MLTRFLIMNKGFRKKLTNYIERKLKNISSHYDDSNSLEKELSLDEMTYTIQSMIMENMHKNCYYDVLKNLYMKAYLEKNDNGDIEWYLTVVNKENWEKVNLIFGEQDECN